MVSTPVKKSDSINEDVAVYDLPPFVVTKYLKQHRMNVQHMNYDQFSLNARYFGRSSFNVQYPPEWNVVGLGAGMKFFAATSLL